MPDKHSVLEIDERGGNASSTKRTIETQIAGLEILRDALAGGLNDTLSDFVELILKSAGRVIVCGMGKSGHIGCKIAATLTSTGTPSFFLHPAEASHGDMGMISEGDVVLALSWSGETRELADVTNYAKRYAVPLAAMTSNPDSTLGKAADIMLLLPKVTEACPHGLEHFHLTRDHIQRLGSSFGTRLV